MVNQSIEQLLQQAVDQSMAQTQESRELAEEVSGKIGDIDQKVDGKIAEMDAKITQATEDVETSVKEKVDLTLYVDATDGLADNSGTNINYPLDTIENAFEKIIPGTKAVVYLKGDGRRYVLKEKIIADGVLVFFSSYHSNTIKPVLTHSAKKNSRNDNIETCGFLLKGGSNFIFSTIEIQTSRWQEWVSSGNPVNYVSALFGTHSNGVTGGRVTFNRCDITLNNSALFQQHVSGTIGWLDTISIVYSSVTKRDLSNDLIISAFQYLVDQYGVAAIPWDFSIIALTINGGVTLPDLISPTVMVENVRSTVPLRA